MYLKSNPYNQWSTHECMLFFFLLYSNIFSAYNLHNPYKSLCLCLCKNKAPLFSAFPLTYFTRVYEVWNLSGALSFPLTFFIANSMIYEYFMIPHTYVRAEIFVNEDEIWRAISVIVNKNSVFNDLTLDNVRVGSKYVNIENIVYFERRMHPSWLSLVLCVPTGTTTVYSSMDTQIGILLTHCERGVHGALALITWMPRTHAKNTHCHLVNIITLQLVKRLQIGGWFWQIVPHKLKCL